ncbi:MAG TPA: hypothetical protein VM008_16880, partial [Phycisphaerae bacterium]|nr:hypothetical protein [Phycisphaerae bacterium]
PPEGTPLAQATRRTPPNKGDQSKRLGNLENPDPHTRTQGAIIAHPISLRTATTTNSAQIYLNKTHPILR